MRTFFPTGVSENSEVISPTFFDSLKIYHVHKKSLNFPSDITYAALKLFKIIKLHSWNSRFILTIHMFIHLLA